MKNNHSFLCQTSNILINIIIKSIVKSIVYLSFRYDTSIGFMKQIHYDTFDTVHIPRINSLLQLLCTVLTLHSYSSSLQVQTWLPFDDAAYQITHTIQQCTCRYMTWVDRVVIGVIDSSSTHHCLVCLLLGNLPLRPWFSYLIEMLESWPTPFLGKPLYCLWV